MMMIMVAVGELGKKNDGEITIMEMMMMTR